MCSHITFPHIDISTFSFYSSIVVFTLTFSIFLFLITTINPHFFYFFFHSFHLSVNKKKPFVLAHSFHNFRDRCDCVAKNKTVNKYRINLCRGGLRYSFCLAQKAFFLKSLLLFLIYYFLLNEPLK
jgi:hypothetical protein